MKTFAADTRTLLEWYSEDKVEHISELPIWLKGQLTPFDGTAKAHSLTLATRNTAAFTATGISLVNPWEDRA